jgi:UDP-glucose 4-epimerase
VDARRALVTGGAGFIGSHVADSLTADGIDVVVYDDFSTGRREFLSRSPQARVVEGDVLDAEALAEAIEGCDVVFHFAANADVRYGLENPNRDLAQNLLATFAVLEAMRAADVKRIVFASTASVYGESDVVPTPETCPFPVQTSLYAASKLAAEGFIEAYCEGYGFSGVILRFVSVLGERYTHGHLFDFYRALRRDPSALTVLGNGKQQKSYVYVGDCVRAVRLVADRHDGEPGVGIYNLGTDEATDVDFSIRLVCEHLGVSPQLSYTGGERGWVGDSPLILLETARLKDLGWRPKLSIADAVGRTLAWFDAHEWVFESREPR